MNKPKDEKPTTVDFADPKQAAIVLHNAGESLLSKIRLNEPVTGNDVAEILAYVCLGFSGVARRSIPPERPVIAKPGPFRRG